MRIPKKLTILGHSYKVTQQSWIKDRSKKGEYTVYGEHTRQKHTIKLRKDLHRKDKEHSFLHEILHAINFRVRDDEELSENQVTMIANRLYAVLNDNKMLR